MNCRTEAKATSKKSDETKEQQMLGTKNGWQCYKDNKSKQKYLLVQVAGSH